MNYNNQNYNNKYYIDIKKPNKNDKTVTKSY